MRAITVAALAMMIPLGPALGNPIQLVTESEAALPIDESVDRAITRGPGVIVVSPSRKGMINSPFNLLIRFESRGGATINKETVLVTYRRIPAIDLTQRLNASINNDGIVLNEAVVPPGVHRIRVEVKDSQGRLGFADFRISVK